MYSLEPAPELAITGSLFSLSGLVAYQYENHITAYLSFLLSLTSIWYHLDRRLASYLLDQIALYSVVARSFVDGYRGGVPGILIACSVNIYNYILYFSPYSIYCIKHPNAQYGNQWHKTIHYAAVLGIMLQQVCIT
jgi:hypothetical protein